MIIVIFMIVMIIIDIIIGMTKVSPLNIFQH